MQKILQQSKLDDKWLNIITFHDDNDLLEWTSFVNYKIFKDENGWYKTYNSCLVFLKTASSDQFIKDNRLFNTIKVRPVPESFSPYFLLTTIHGNNRFNDLESGLSNVLISLKTYNNIYDYHEHYRFKDARLKGLDSSQKQEVFGLALKVINN